MSQPELVRDSIFVTEVLLDSSIEQSVELDYYLPDYYPNIFKLLKTTVTPSIQSCKVSGNLLSLDGTAVIRVLYLAEETNALCCVNQNMPFSKTIELASECRNPTVQIQPRCYFANGRAVNQRRLDIRGGISCRVRVSDQREQQIVTGGSGGGLQLRMRKMPVCGARVSGSKVFSLNEELELGSVKPTFGTLLRYSACAVPTETRLIANKAICKADLTLHLFYLPAEGGQPETMEYSLPISQIIDLPGVAEDAECTACFTVTGVTAEAKNAESGESRMITCEISMTASCIADKNQEIVAVDDAYSTICEAELTTCPAAVECLLQEADLTVTARSKLETAEAVSTVCDVCAEFGEYSVLYEEGALSLDGNLEITALCVGTEGIPFVAGQTFLVQLRLLDGLQAEEISFQPQVELMTCGYTLLSDNAIEVRTELRVSGPVYEKCRFPAITDIVLREDLPRERDPLCALRICYAEPGDSIWDIARSYSTSMTAVMEENDLESEQVTARTMLLIPLIDG